MEVKEGHTDAVPIDLPMMPPATHVQAPEVTRSTDPKRSAEFSNVTSWADDFGQDYGRLHEAGNVLPPQTSDPHGGSSLANQAPRSSQGEYALSPQSMPWTPLTPGSIPSQWAWEDLATPSLLPHVSEPPTEGATRADCPRPAPLGNSTESVELYGSDAWRYSNVTSAKSQSDTTSAPIAEQGTALHHAARFDRVMVVRLLLRRGCDPTARNIQGRTALHVAAEHGSIETIKLLLNLPQVDLETYDTSGLSALHLAAAAGHEAVVALLLDRGADLAR